MIKSLDSKARVTLIPNGVDLQIFKPRPQTLAKRPFHVLCVARLIERKGQHYLIEAVKKLTDLGIEVVLSLVGTGDSQKDYERKAMNLGIQSHVQFVGYVSREEISLYYNAAHVFVLPSYNEGMSLAVLEAMAAGLPVVVTRTGGTTELVEEGVNGFVFDWADVDTLTNYLHVLAADHSLLRNMGAASRSRAKGFSWEIIANRFLRLFYADSIGDSPISI
jgi:glycosyltransferase involved in cell wall biosynthesis